MRKPSEQDRFVDEQTRMKWKCGWHVWSHLSFEVKLFTSYYLLFTSY